MFEDRSDKEFRLNPILVVGTGKPTSSPLGMLCKGDQKPEWRDVIPWDAQVLPDFSAYIQRAVPQERTQQNWTRAPLDESPPARSTEVVQEVSPGVSANGPLPHFW